MLAAEPAGPPAQGPSPAAQTPHRESVGFSIDAPEFSSDEFRIFSFKVGASVVYSHPRCRCRSAHPGQPCTKN